MGASPHGGTRSNLITAECSSTDSHAGVFLPLEYFRFCSNPKRPDSLLLKLIQHVRHSIENSDSAAHCQATAAHLNMRGPFNAAESVKPPSLYLCLSPTTLSLSPSFCLSLAFHLSLSLSHSLTHSIRAAPWTAQRQQFILHVSGVT